MSNEGASLEELDAKLLQLAQREIDALGTSEAVVTISCDEDLAYEAVRRILESCRRATIWRVWLLGREDDLTSPGGWSTRFHPLPLGRPAPGGARDDPAAPAALVLHLAPADPPGGVGSIHLGAVAVADLADLEKTISKELSARERREVELAIRIEDGVRWGDAVQAICVARRALEAEHELFVEVED